MTDRDIIIVYVKEYILCPEKFEDFNKYVKKVNEDIETKVIVLPFEYIEKVERL